MSADRKPAIVHRKPAIVHRTLVDSQYRYFGTIKEVKAAAIEQMRKRGGKGYSYESFPREGVIDLLNGQQL